MSSRVGAVVVLGLVLVGAVLGVHSGIKRSHLEWRRLELARLNQQLEKLYGEGKYLEAVGVARRGVEVSETGPNTDEQWAAIEAEVSKRPDAPAELQRLHAYLQWSDALRRFREAPAADRAALAATIEQGLAERIRQGEVSAGEARQIESALLALTGADEAERAERLRQWAATELTAGAAADPRQAAFERRQAEIVAAWSAQPASARDPAALERELETLRRLSFAPAGAR